MRSARRGRKRLTRTINFPWKVSVVSLRPSAYGGTTAVVLLPNTLLEAQEELAEPPAQLAVVGAPPRAVEGPVQPFGAELKNFYRKYFLRSIWLYATCHTYPRYENRVAELAAPDLVDWVHGTEH